jgi:hypothetical protein
VALRSIGCLLSTIGCLLSSLEMILASSGKLSMVDPSKVLFEGLKDQIQSKELAMW